MRLTPEIMRNIMLNRLRQLQEHRKKTERGIKRAPEGKLRISNKKSGPQYYCRKDKKDKTGIYIPKGDIIVAKKLAQKDYDLLTLKALKSEIMAIEKFLKAYPEAAAEEVYLHMTGQRKELINPLDLTDEMYAERWLNEEFERKNPIDPDKGFTTDHGEIVRSKSEWIIANLLAKYGVPYRYECKMLLVGFGTVHPDFIVLNVRERKVKYWEHEGRMDDSDYVEKAIRRERAYIRNGYMPGDTLILTSETTSQPLDTIIIKSIIEKYCL